MTGEDYSVAFGFAIGVLVTILLQIVTDTFFRRHRKVWPYEKAAKFNRATRRRLKAQRAVLTESLMNREVQR